MKASIRQGAVLAVVVAGLGAITGGCLSRPLATGEPTLKTNFTTVVQNNAIDKVDLLFDIDNSASMGDKQSYLIQAIPDLINRLVNPNCVDSTTMAFVAASTGGTCPAGSQLEFPPVHDMHLGIVTSALGQRLSDSICLPSAMAGQAGQPFATVSAHNDDQGHLIARSLNYNAGMTDATEGQVAHAVIQSYMPAPSGFLYWYPGTNPPPTGPANPETTVGAAGQANTLIGDFGSMVGGVGIWGCGIESQLESWYRFLIQPDPYASLVNAANPVDMWNSVDAQILQQRKDFLRPDSLVAVIVLTDENDSEIDVRSLGGNGYLFMKQGFNPPKATSACAGNPSSSACVSCSVNSNDSACACSNNQAACPNNSPYQVYSAANDWGFDANLRHVHMKAKYGVDPQYPIQRYVIGLQSPVVPDRNGEYKNADGSNAANYVGRNDCTNPLYASVLPDGSDLSIPTLCNLPLGSRSSSSVFYAIIGGVPNQLLHFDPNNLTNSHLNDSDWVKILGKGPAATTLSSPPSYDYNGIDPHMIEDYRDRTTVNYGFTPDPSGTNALSPSSGAPANGDPVNGREWVTDQEMTANTHVLRVDRQYACIFPLATPRDCTLAQNANSCDCPSTMSGLTPAQIPPLCSPSNPTQQIAAKAYPTTRELLVARMMGTQGVVSSLCPIDVTPQGANDPLYGYRPAVAVIIDRLKNALNSTCLPEQLQLNSDGTVPCLILVQAPANYSGGGTCLNPVCTEPGLVVPTDTTVLQAFCQAQEQAFMGSTGAGNAQLDPKNRSVCQLAQLVNSTTGSSSPAVIANPNDFSGPSCTASSDVGWCYAQGDKGCPQSIEFSKQAPPAGWTASLQCIYSSGLHGPDGG